MRAFEVLSSRIKRADVKHFVFSTGSAFTLCRTTLSFSSATKMLHLVTISQFFGVYQEAGKPRVQLGGKKSIYAFPGVQQNPF